MEIKTYPEAGQKISLTVKTTSYVIGTDPIRIIKYDNVEVLPYRFDDPPRCVRIRTNPIYGYPDTYASVVCFDEVIEYLIDGVPYKDYIETKKPQNKLSAIKIKGSKGNEYSITVIDNKARACSCPGFQFRSNCRHLREAQAILDNT